MSQPGENQQDEVEQENGDFNTDTILLNDTQFSEQKFLSDEEQSSSLNQSSMSHFKIIDILGKGGMGAVYKAKDLALERFVAIKMLRISQSKQPLILTEAKTISKLNHPNIVTVYDIARDKDANFIVMEWINGRPLNMLIPPNGFSVDKVLRYAKQIVSAIACAHQQHVIHRDIKPQNIMVTADDTIKILDFGIASLIESQSSASDQLADSEPTASKDFHLQSTMVGSPQYMAPEQIKGEASDIRSDLFSLGIVLYEMLVGVKPFLGLNIEQISQTIIQGKYIPLAEHIADFNAQKNTETKGEIPEKLMELVDKLLQTAPSKRYQSAEELAQDIAIIDEQVNHKKNWWQQQHWLTKSLLILPIVSLLSWSIRGVLFPPSTQELIARQLVESKKIAFLPFDNISGDPVLQIFSDGVATMLSSDLAEVGYQQGDGTTWVLPTSEIRQLEDVSVEGIYNKYGVDFIVTGTIQHMGSTRSLHLGLVNGADGRQLKSVQLTLDAEKLFEAQSQIRDNVINLLGWQIPPELNQKLAQKKPTFDGAYKHYLAGQGYLYRFDHGDNIENAIEAFKAAIAIDVSYADAYVGLAETQRYKFIQTKQSQMLEFIEKTIEQLAVIDSSHLLLSSLKAQLMRSQGNYEGAVKLFKQSIQQKPFYSSSYVGLADSYQRLGQQTEAEQVLLIAYQLMPNNNSVLIELGAFYFNTGNYTKALNYFELLAKQAPNNYMAYLNISACLYLMGDIKEAILAAEKSLSIEKSADTYANIGTSYFILKDYDKAVFAYEKMIALNDSNFLNWGDLADAYRFTYNKKQIKAYTKAISLAEQAIELNPNNKEAIASLAYYYANIDDLEKTNFYAKQISDKDSGVDSFFIAAAYTRLNMKAKALHYLKLAIANNYSIAEISDSPLLYGLRSEPEFIQLITKK